MQHPGLTLQKRGIFMTSSKQSFVHYLLSNISREEPFLQSNASELLENLQYWWYFSTEDDTSVLMIKCGLWTDWLIEDRQKKYRFHLENKYYNVLIQVSYISHSINVFVNVSFYCNFKFSMHDILSLQILTERLLRT